MEGITINVDSSYIGFVFLLVTEIVIMRFLVSSHLKSMEATVKKALDKGENVKIDLRDLGPFRIHTGLGWFKAFRIALIPCIFFLMITCSELGISGRSIPSYTEVDIITMGGYYSLDRFTYEKAEEYIQSEWNQCMVYKNDMEISGGKLASTFSIDDDFFNFEDSVCEEPSVSIIRGEVCSEFDIVNYTIASSELIYEYYSRPRGDYEWLYDFHDLLVYRGDVNIDACEEIQSKDVYMVAIKSSEDDVIDDDFGDDVFGGLFGDDLFDDDDDLVYDIWNTFFIIDKSEIVGREKWVIIGAHQEERQIEPLPIGVGFSYFEDSVFTVECENCFETIVEWLFQDNSLITTEIEDFFRIWYSGLTYNSTSIPYCSIDETYLKDAWISEEEKGFLAGPSCEDEAFVVDQREIGSKNVTTISLFSIVLMTIALFGTVIYYCWTRVSARSVYDLFTYEGMSKLVYKTSHPMSEWHKGGCLEVYSVDGIIKLVDQENFRPTEVA